MTWPLSQDYNEAIQSPSSSLDDPELRAGQPTTNALGMPQPRSGNFADVYEFECPQTQTRWAVKCFTREVSGLRERYAEISRYLKDAQLPFAVDFQYLEKGVRIRGAWYPALKMRWVEGQLLNEFVRDNLGNPARLQALSHIWARMAKRLREANLAHADLQHGNVILVPGRTANSLAVKLIDYDGMFVPALAGRGSGEVGHANYQHPQRIAKGTYGPEVDRFPLLVVSTALRALTVGGKELWDRYDNGDNLLFKESDLQAPTKSPLFRDLLQIADPETHSLVMQLIGAVGRPLEECPLLGEALPEKAVAPARPTPSRAEKAFGFPEEKPTRRQPGKSHVPLIAGVAAAGLAALGLVIGVVWATRPATDKANPTPPVAEVGKEDGKKVPDKTPVVKPPEDANILPAKVGEIRRFEGGPAVAFSPDGRTAAYANAQNDITLWDLAKSKEIGQFAGHEKKVSALRFSPDSRRILSGSDDGTVRLWDVKTTRESKRFPGLIEGVRALAWRPDGRSVVTYSGEAVRAVVTWNAETGVEVRRASTGINNWGSAFSPSGALLLLGGHDEIDHIWNVASDRVTTASERHPNSHSYAATFSADGCGSGGCAVPLGSS